MNKLVNYILFPFREGGSGALLGGTFIIFLGEFLQKLGGFIGPYGSIPGLIIKIGALCLCFNYSLQIVRSSYSGSKTLPFWETPSLHFGELLKNLIPILISIFYGLFLTSLVYFIVVIVSNKNLSLILFFTHLPRYGFFVFFSIFLPAVYFLFSVAPDDIEYFVNPVWITRVIIKTFPCYLFLTIAAYFLTLLFVYFRIPLIFIGNFITWFVKFYFLILFAFIVGRTYSKLNLSKQAQR